MPNDSFNQEVENADLSSPITNDDGLFADENIGKISKEIADVVKCISSDYKDRIRKRNVYQTLITIMLVVITSLFFIGFVAIVVLASVNLISNLELVITLISSIATTFIVSVVSLLLIVVKYNFPLNQDENNLSVLTKIHSANLEFGRRDNKKMGNEQN